MMTELLAHGNDRVVRAMSGALRNLAIDARNRDLLGESICGAELFQTEHGGQCGSTINSCPVTIRSTRGASPGGQPAWRRPESAGAGTVRRDGGVGIKHPPRAAGLQPGGCQDPAGLARHREAGAHQQRRVSGDQSLGGIALCPIGVSCFDFEFIHQEPFRA